MYVNSFCESTLILVSISFDREQRGLLRRPFDNGDEMHRSCDGNEENECFALASSAGDIGLILAE